MLTEEQKEAEAKRDQEYAQEREAIARKWKSHLLTRWAYRLACGLAVGEEELTRPGAWLDGVYCWVLCRLPWTREHRVRELFGSTVLFAAPDGHIHVSWLQWEWLDGSQEHGGFTVTECENWPELEGEALAHLAAQKKALTPEALTPCPKHLAKRARWEEETPEGKGK